MTRKTKLSGSVDMLHCHIDKQRQVNGERAIRQRKREERLMVNLNKWSNQQIKLKLKDADRPTKRQKLSDQIQRGFDIAEKWQNEKEKYTTRNRNICRLSGLVNMNAERIYITWRYTHDFDLYSEHVLFAC